MVVFQVPASSQQTLCSSVFHPYTVDPGVLGVMRPVSIVIVTPLMVIMSHHDHETLCPLSTTRHTM